MLTRKWERRDSALVRGEGTALAKRQPGRTGGLERVPEDRQREGEAGMWGRQGRPFSVGCRVRGQGCRGTERG